MFDLSPETEIRADQAEAIARGLIAVAKADGQIHEREAALITDFYSATTDRALDFTSLEKAEPATGEYLAAVLGSEDLRRMFLKTAMLLAYVDGKYSNTESKLIGEYGVALGFGSDMPALEQEVKEFMLSQLTGIRNTAAVAEVAKELKL